MTMTMKSGLKIDARNLFNLNQLQVNTLIKNKNYYFLKYIFTPG